jgi:cyclopropane-fatty-acyl-phospholipid synthase
MNTFDAAVDSLEKRYRSYFGPGEEVPFAVRSDGQLRKLGPGEPRFTLVSTSEKGNAALRSVDLLAVASAYLDGDLELEGDLIAAIGMRDFFHDRHPFQYLMRFVGPLIKGQVKKDKEWIAQHYDYDEDFYLLFLDQRHRCYSQGVFERDDESLEDAMTRKLEFAVSSTGLREGDRVLDIGGGWGAFTEFGGKRGLRVTSLTISKESKRFLDALVEREKLPCTVLQQHFFEHRPAEPYDAIVNLGVTEHLPDYAATVAHYLELLRPGGKVYLDASATRKRGGHTAFLEKFVYPGNGSLMCLHELLAEVAMTPLRLRGVWDDNHSYYLTLRHWAQRLDAHREQIERRWGKALHRKFQLYLWGAAEGHRTWRNQAYRVVLEKPPVG